MSTQRKRTRRPAPSPAEPGVGAPETYTVMDPAGNEVQVPMPTETPELGGIVERFDGAKGQVVATNDAGTVIVAPLEATADGMPMVSVLVEALREGADPLMVQQAEAELAAFLTADPDGSPDPVEEPDELVVEEEVVEEEVEVSKETSEQRRRRQRYERMALAHQARVGNPRTYVVGARPLKVAGELRQPGAEVPEALTWPRVETWVSTGKIVPVPA